MVTLWSKSHGSCLLHRLAQGGLQHSPGQGVQEQVQLTKCPHGLCLLWPQLGGERVGCRVLKNLRSSREAKAPAQGIQQESGRTRAHEAFGQSEGQAARGEQHRTGPRPQASVTGLAGLSAHPPQYSPESHDDCPLTHLGALKSAGEQLSGHSQACHEGCRTGSW